MAKHAGGQQPADVCGDYAWRLPFHSGHDYHVINAGAGRILVRDADADVYYADERLTVKSSTSRVAMALCGTSLLCVTIVGSDADIIVDGQNHVDSLLLTSGDNRMENMPEVCLKPSPTGHHAPSLTVSRIDLEHADLTVMSVSLTVDGPKTRSLVDAVTYGDGAEYGTGLVTLDSDSRLLLENGSELRLDGSVTPGRRLVHYDQQAGVAVSMDILHESTMDGDYRLASYATGGAVRLEDYVHADSSSAILRKNSMLSSWEPIDLRDAHPIISN